jgi:hypothetical protein
MLPRHTLGHFFFKCPFQAQNMHNRDQFPKYVWAATRFFWAATRCVWAEPRHILFGKMGSQVFTKKKYAVCLYCLQIKIKRTPTATNCYEIRSCSIHGERDWKGPLTPVIKGSAPFPSMGNVIRKHHCPVLFFLRNSFFYVA